MTAFQGEIQVIEKFGRKYLKAIDYLNKQQEFMKYLEEAVRRNPQEAGIVLSNLFPDGMEPKDYIKYMKDKLSL